MSLIEEHEAWLEGDGEPHILQGNCSIGRAALNTLVLESPKVSRLHAIIHLEKPGEFWLVDLGSNNGTFLNKRRIHEPVRMRDQDQIKIGGKAFIFHQSRQSSGKSSGPVLTLQEKIENVPCWLLVADIMNFTVLSRELGSDKLAARLGETSAISDAAHARLKGLLSSRSLGSNELKGFEVMRSLFGVSLAQDFERSDIFPPDRANFDRIKRTSPGRFSEKDGEAATPQPISRLRKKL